MTTPEMHFHQQSIDVKLDGDNYRLWSYSLRVILRSRGLWGHIDGTTKPPTKPTPTGDLTKDSAALSSYESNLMTWTLAEDRAIAAIVQSVSPSIRLQLARFDTAISLWAYLQRLYTQSDDAREFQLYQEISMVTQGDRSIREFYTHIFDRWEQLAALETPLTDPASRTIHHNNRDRQRLFQFLMKLRPEFESVRSQLIHRSPRPTLEAAVTELQAEETRLHLNTLSISPSSVHATPRSSTHRGPPYHQHTSSTRQQQPGLTPTRKQWCDIHKLCGHTTDQCRSRPAKRPPPTPQATVNETSSTTPSHTDLLQALHPSTPSPNTGSAATSYVTQSGTKTNSWILDSGATHHLTSSQTYLHNQTPLPPTAMVRTADGTPLPMTSVGHLHIKPQFSIPNVHHVPNVQMNLLSVSQITSHNYTATFSASSCLIQDPRTGETVGTGRNIGGLYYMDKLILPTPTASVIRLLNSKPTTCDLWHRRLGHLSLSRLRTLSTTGKLGNFSADTLSPCTGCKLAKHLAQPFPINNKIASAPFDLIHTDIWGPSPHPSRGDNRYYITFIDDHSRFTWVYLMKHKSDAYDIYKNFAIMILTQFSSRIKILRSDSGGEYTSRRFTEFLASQGTLPQFSCPYAHQQNGVAERRHRHILETTRSLLLSASVPVQFWAEALLTSVYLINRTPSTTLKGLTPFQQLHQTPPNYSHLRVFGCTCFVQLPSSERNKLSPRSVMCIFLGYSLHHKGYRCYDPHSDRLRISPHVTFFEHLPYYALPSPPVPLPPSTPTDLIFLELDTPNSPAPQITPELSPETSSSTEQVASPNPPPDAQDQPAPPQSSIDPEPPTTDIPPATRYPTRDRQPPAKYRDPNFTSIAFHTVTMMTSDYVEPHSYHDAVKHPEWQQAMQDELTALQQTHTWDLTPLPPGKTPISCKWTYKVKTRADGTIERHKARLVARGFTQQYGVDYEETFAPVAKMTTIRTLLAVAASRQWPLYQMDVKNAFLHGKITEDIYMTPPPGLPHPKGLVCHLRRALYGLKQAPRAWFARFTQAMQPAGFLPSENDPAMFISSSNGQRTILLLYVDDMIITGDNPSSIQHIKSHLQREFEMKDLGHLHYFLGLEINQTPRGYHLSQQKFATAIINRADLRPSKPAQTPLELNVKLNNTDGDPLPDATQYRHLVGSLVYLTITRPDISHAVHVLSQFVATPRSPHQSALLRVLHYIRETSCRALFFSTSSSLILRGYSDADWAGNTTDRRSTTGYCIFLGDSLISWKSKKQDVVSRSSAESEYRAMASTTAEIVWLRRLLLDMGVSPTTATPLHCDNMSAIKIASNPVFHERTKHIEIDCHFTRHHLLTGTISLPYVHTDLQLADLFTKAHTIKRHLFLIDKLPLVNPTAV